MHVTWDNLITGITAIVFFAVLSNLIHYVLPGDMPSVIKNNVNASILATVRLLCLGAVLTSAVCATGPDRLHLWEPALVGLVLYVLGTHVSARVFPGVMSVVKTDKVEPGVLIAAAIHVVPTALAVAAILS